MATPHPRRRKEYPMYLRISEEEEEEGSEEREQKWRGEMMDGFKEGFRMGLVRALMGLEFGDWWW